VGAPVKWFEIATSGSEEVGAFYSNVFGWKLQPLEGGYTLVETGGDGGIPGGIGGAEGPNQVTFYLEVDDLQAYLDRVEQAGGKVVVPVTELPMVTFAQFADPQGNVVGLMKG
jgi:predicted enzyme related to lactoylglutathione lyase